MVISPFEIVRNHLSIRHVTERLALTHLLSNPPVRRNLILSLAILGGLLAALLLLLPAEQTLGPVIKAVFLHGALVRTGLLLFAISGVLGIGCLMWDRPMLLAWTLAIQQAAVILWVAYALSSMVTTYMAWGEWIAWDEPRVRASVHVLWFSLASLGLVLWVKNRIFTGLANLAVAIMAWMLIKGATLARHPFNPIGESQSVAYSWFFIAMTVVVLLIALQLTRGLAGRQNSAES